MEALAKLGIDGWGLLLYVVNFGVLIWLMHRFAYKPLTRMMDERREVIKRNVEEAQHLRADLEEKAQSEASERTRREHELDLRVSEAKSVARKEAKAMIEEAQAQREAILSQATLAADAAVADTIERSEKEILDRVRRVVAHVLESDVSQDVVEASVTRSWKTLSK